MQASNLVQLGQLVTAAVGWRTTASTVNVNLTQIQAVMPDGSLSVLLWDDNSSSWNIVTSSA
jgi:hypothetical protein